MGTPSDSGEAAATASPLVERRDAWIDRHDGKREIRLRSEEPARWIAAAIALLVAVGSVRWAFVTQGLLDVELSRSDRWLQALQYVIALPGVLAGIVLAVYAARFATSGRTWRRWRGIAIAFAALVTAWSLVFVIGALIL